MCDCIKWHEERLKRQLNAHRVQFDHFGHQGTGVRYTPYRLDGQPYKPNRFLYVDWKFCPFCGVSI